MKRIVLTYGLISGAMLSALTLGMLGLKSSGKIDFGGAEIVGYSSMLAAFLLVFFGVRSYRDTVRGGSITFGQAFKTGILITLITCAAYVLVWEIVYFNFMPDFADRYAEYAIEKMRSGGASEVAIAAERAKMARFRELYDNVFINAGITFLEVFPVGLIVTLVSAGILRRKSQDPVSAAAIAA